MGGRVGLKGTDGLVEEALNRGALPVAPARAGECINVLKAGRDRLEILTCSGEMGEDLLDGFDFDVVYECGGDTTSDDTVKACSVLIGSGVGLILFCGGDGTARDVFEAVGDSVPVLGIPSGVKMHSSVFAVNPVAAGELVLDFVNGDAGLHEAEVVDVDEEAYRENELKTRLYGLMYTPYRQDLVQASKAVYHAVDDEQAKREIAEFAAEFMGDGSAYIVGAGSTTKAIGDRLGVDKTLLGVDVLKDGEMVFKDAGEKDLLTALEGEDTAKIIVSPIGAQGFVFGRGTQQISPEVIRRVGVDNIIYVSTQHKLNAVPHLLVDSGDMGLDSEIAGYRSVVIGYRLSQRKDIRAVAGGS
ncbi:MAG: ATP-NAD kinase [Candidatus Altiarchaeales archaeon]|nr:ATP-NAD kinase [Candidatus Altiarchaeales archaeon]MBD3415944.1 ATP-NAD kinase [Candidatus Altiarchaeales archaeon]